MKENFEVNSYQRRLNPHVYFNMSHATDFKTKLYYDRSWHQMYPPNLSKATYSSTQSFYLARNLSLKENDYLITIFNYITQGPGIFPVFQLPSFLLSSLPTR